MADIWNWDEVTILKDESGPASAFKLGIFITSSLLPKQD
jgi:hypothetical protein